VRICFLLESKFVNFFIPYSGISKLGETTMPTNYNIKKMDAKIKEIRKAAEELQELGQDIEAVNKNLVRLLASTKMLELNISDAMLV
jgi:pyridoxine 5'-phosphate synthase PdxJ